MSPLQGSPFSGISCGTSMAAEQHMSRCGSSMCGSTLKWSQVLEIKDKGIYIDFYTSSVIDLNQGVS